MTTEFRTTESATTGGGSFVKALANQRRAAMVAAALAVAAVWVAFGLGHWLIGVFLAAGIVLGLFNHVLTERTLLKSVGSQKLGQDGHEINRTQYAISSLTRLIGVSIVAIGLAVAFWPDGAAVLFGLAIFHLITLVFTGIPLLKEVRKA